MGWLKTKPIVSTTTNITENGKTITHYWKDQTVNNILKRTTGGVKKL